MKNKCLEKNCEIKRSARGLCANHYAAHVRAGDILRFAKHKSDGVSESSGGYILKRCKGHPRATKQGFYVFEHILIMEKYLGRYLAKDEVVHHINHNQTDNRISNLVVMTKSEHSKLHTPDGFGKYWAGKKRSQEYKDRMAEIKKEWWRNKKCKKNI